MKKKYTSVELIAILNERFEKLVENKPSLDNLKDYQKYIGKLELINELTNELRNNK